MQTRWCSAVLGLVLGCISQSIAGQAPASTPQKAAAQTRPSAEQPSTPAARVYIGTDGHPHLPLTPEGDIQTVPNVQLPLGPPTGAVRITGGVRATPNFPPCPPNDEAVRQARENVADKEWPHRMAYALFFGNMEELDRMAEQSDKKEDHKKRATK